MVLDLLRKPVGSGRRRGKGRQRVPPEKDEGGRGRREATTGVGGEVLTPIGEEGFDWDGREAEGKEGRKEGRKEGEERRGEEGIIVGSTYQSVKECFEYG
jgi:hypothetical protein